MFAIASNVSRMYVMTFAILSDCSTMQSMSSSQLIEYVSSCYVSCVALKEPIEIDYAPLFCRPSDKIMKYIEDNPIVMRKMDSIKCLVRHLDKTSALQSLIININQRDMLSVAKGNRLKINDHHAERAVHEYLKKNKTNAVMALRLASSCELRIFNAVMDLLVCEYTEPEIEAMLDEIYKKTK